MGEHNDSENLYKQLSVALGEDIQSVQRMGSEERNQLLKGKILIRMHRLA